MDKVLQKPRGRDFSGGPVVKTSPSNAGSAGSIPSQEAKIPHFSWPKKKKTQNIKNRSNIVTNLIKTLKTVLMKNLKKKKKGKKPRGGRKTGRYSGREHG